MMLADDAQLPSKRRFSVSSTLYTDTEDSKIPRITENIVEMASKSKNNDDILEDNKTGSRASVQDECPAKNAALVAAVRPREDSEQSNEAGE